MHSCSLKMFYQSSKISFKRISRLNSFFYLSIYKYFIQIRSCLYIFNDMAGCSVRTSKCFRFKERVFLEGDSSVFRDPPCQALYYNNDLTCSSRQRMYRLEIRLHLPSRVLVVCSVAVVFEIEACLDDNQTSQVHNKGQREPTSTPVL